MPTLHVPLRETAIGHVTVTVPDSATEEQILAAAEAAYLDGGAFINRSQATFRPSRAEAA